MDFLDDQDYPTSRLKPNNRRIEVDVILLGKSAESLVIQLDESSSPFDISRSGIKIQQLDPKTKIATLNLSERKAISLALI